MLTDKALRLVDEAAAMEQQEARDAGSLGFFGRVLAQTSMPYRDPGDVPAWGRRNGKLHLVIQPGYTFDDSGAPKSMGVPWGVMPRLVLTWITTEAVRTRSRELVLGTTLAEFMGELGLQPTGGRWGSIRSLREQMRRLCAASISAVFEDEHQLRIERVPVVDRAALWWDPQVPAQGTLLPSTLSLSERFFGDLTSRPVPIDLRAIKALRGSSMRLDLYVWLTYRMSYLHRRTVVPWELLALQFGAKFADTPKGRWRFRQELAEQLVQVLVVYPGAKVDIVEAGLELRPSPTHVPRVA